MRNLSSSSSYSLFAYASLSFFPVPRLPCAVLLGLALCGVGYSTDDLGLKKHNIMAKDKVNTEKGCGMKGRVNDKGLVQGATDPNGPGPCKGEAPRRKLFKVSLSPCFCHEGV
jgi:hypothetical protein